MSVTTSMTGSAAPEGISRRWLRIIPVALVMYTIAFIDRTNISLALPVIDVVTDMASDCTTPIQRVVGARHAVPVFA